LFQAAMPTSFCSAAPGWAGAGAAAGALESAWAILVAVSLSARTHMPAEAISTSAAHTSVRIISLRIEI
jgi:hypothetical protein